jgi:hypothetical protein
MAGFWLARAVAISSRMHKLTPLLLAAALGTAMVFSMSTPYDLMAENAAINRSPAAEVLKTVAKAEAMQATYDHPDLPPGAVVVLPGRS